MELDAITNKVLDAIDTEGFRQEGAYNLRYNGQALCHGDSEYIKIKRKEDRQGIDVYISGEAQGEQVHIPVVVSASGMTESTHSMWEKTQKWFMRKNTTVKGKAPGKIS